MIERASIRFTDLPDEEFDMPLGLGTGQQSFLAQPVVLWKQLFVLQ